MSIPNSTPQQFWDWSTKYMPFVTIKIARGHSIEKKRRLVESLTNTLVSVLDTKPEWITIHIDEFERENWAVNGILHSDRHRGKHDETGR